ncbi:MAG: CehA/McbA family metallohydrolase [Oscillospiraceae bacterium]|jgi:hypothetical protein|nr:CehA/McbA family metallohydrolase [Oscillospiraceae bacterium]
MLESIRSKSGIGAINRAVSLLLAICLLFSLCPAAFAADPPPVSGVIATVAGWSYSAIPPEPDRGNVPATSGVNQDGAALSNHYKTISGYATGSLNLTDWTPQPAYWELAFSGDGFTNLDITLSQRSSNTGPRDFAMSYSLDGGATWTEINGSSIAIASTNLATTYSGFSLPAALDNADSILLRLYKASNTSLNGGTVASGGVSNINNVIIRGVYSDGNAPDPSPDPNPEPEKVANVTANPESSTIVTSGTVDVTLSCATEGAEIKYQVGAAGYSTYAGPFTVTDFPATVTAYAVKEGMEDSAASSFTYYDDGSSPANNLRPYFGQLHAHTSNSDGTGSYDDAYTAARYTADLDFFAVTDHSNYFDSSSNLGNMATGGGANGSRWTNMTAAADKYNEDGGFVALAGFEMTWSNKEYGHINTFNTPGYVSRNDPYYNTAGGAGLKRYYDEIAQYPASISQFNHPGTTFGDFSDFAYYNPAVDKVMNLIEVGNGDGTNKQLNTGYWRSDAYYDRALSLGWHVAPSNNQDNHRANWGIANNHRTVVLAESLTRANVYDALSNRRVYATEDKNIEVLYFVNNEPMGTIMSSTPSSLHFDISITEHSESIGTVSLITKGGQAVWSQNVTGDTADISFDLTPDYDYYYVKIVQADGDMILTAPVWVSSNVTVDETGISSAEFAQGTPLVGSPIGLDVKLFNYGSYPLYVNSVAVYDSSDKLIKNDTVSLTVTSLTSYSTTVTPAQVGLNVYKLVVTGTVNGAEKTYTYTTRLTAKDPSGITRIVVDASHGNMYVNGQYSGGLAAIEQNLAGDGIVFVYADALTDGILSDAAAVLITTPENRSGSAARSNFSAQDIQVLKSYADNGGSFIIMARADYGEDSNYQTSVMLNNLLYEIGATTKVNSDELIWGGSTSVYTIEQKLTYNTQLEWMQGLPFDLNFRIWSGASLIPGANTVPVVSGITGVSSYDSSSAGKAADVGTGSDIVFAAQEELPGGGTAFIGGGVFFTTYNEVDKSAYLNHHIAEAMIRTLQREAAVSAIAEARQGAPGQAFTVEGILTTHSAEASRDNAFFDCIYIQDNTGGICIHPVTDLQLYVGQKVRISGVIKEYLGDKELGIPDGIEESDAITLLDAAKNPISPEEMTTAGSMTKASEGLLVTVTGTVVSVDLQKGAVIVDDGTGAARLLIEGYIHNSATGATGIPDFVTVGTEITAVGLASVDGDGNRLRVRDLAEITPAQPKAAAALVIGFVYFGTDNSSSGTHSFVEIYNPGDEAVTLTGNYSLQYKSMDTVLTPDWLRLDLVGTIPAHSSFLVNMGATGSAPSGTVGRLDLTERTFDQDFTAAFGKAYNKGVKVVIMAGQTTIDSALNNPFTGDGAGKLAGYVDMFGVSGNDNSKPTVDGYETACVPAGDSAAQSKQKGFVRMSADGEKYADTDNNLTDFMQVDFRSSDLSNSKLLPRGLADGAWGSDPVPTAAVKNAVLNIGGTEAQRSVVWYSDSTAAGEVQLAFKSAMTGDTFPVSHQTFNAARTTSGVSGFGSYQAAITGLAANTEYVYRAGNSEGWSDVYSFKTGSFDGGFSFLAAGDPQIGSSGNAGKDTEGWTATLNKAKAWFPDVSFLISLGDQVETSNVETQYDGFLTPDYLRSVTLATNIGNHDTGNGGGIYKEHFNMPNSSASLGVTASGGDYWYSYDGALLMSINTNNTSTAEHKAFIIAAIEAYKAQNGGADPLWKIVTFHHSVYSSATHVTDTEIILKRSELPIVFRDLGIDAVLQGHDHVYTRSYVMNGTAPITSGYTADGANATAAYTVDPTKNVAGSSWQTVYITANSASGSKYYANVNSSKEWVAASNQENTPNITKVDVTADALTFTTYRTGAGNTVSDVVDTFTLSKAPAQVPADKPLASIRTNETSVVTEPVEYIVSLRGLDRVSTVKLTFTADGNLLEFKDMETLNGFTALAGSGSAVTWRELDGGLWQGEVTLIYGYGTQATISSEVSVDVAKIIHYAKGLGDAAMTLTGIQATGLVTGSDGKDRMEYLDCGIEQGKDRAVTSIDATYSVYDLNKDGAVDQLDLAIMVLYCQIGSGDPRWNSLIIAYDMKGGAITAALCDVNGDGMVDMIDLLGLYLNYTR